MNQIIKFQAGRIELLPEIVSLSDSQVKKNTTHIFLYLFIFS